MGNYSLRGPVQIGVDFGGTKIEAAALGPHGDILARVRAPTPRDYDSAIRAVCELVGQVERDAGAGGSVGIGSPGSLSPRTGLMRGSNSTYVNGRPFSQDLGAALGRSIRLANDANCLALSEAVDGAAAGARTTFAVIIGTGVGGGLVIDGKIVGGANGMAGEWGHISLPWPRASEIPGPTCWCGQLNCLETWVSGTGLRRDFAEASGRKLTGEEIISAAVSGDKEAEAAFDRYVDRLGRGLAMVVNLFDPDAFVFGGGVSNVSALYERLPQAMRPYVFSDVWSARLAPAKWGDSSGVRGAARLWPVGAMAD